MKDIIRANGEHFDYNYLKNPNENYNSLDYEKRQLVLFDKNNKTRNLTDLTDNNSFDVYVGNNWYDLAGRIFKTETVSNDNFSVDEFSVNTPFIHLKKEKDFNETDIQTKIIWDNGDYSIANGKLNVIKNKKPVNPVNPTKPEDETNNQPTENQSNKKRIENATITVSNQKGTDAVGTIKILVNPKDAVDDVVVKSDTNLTEISKNKETGEIVYTYKFDRFKTDIVSVYSKNDLNNTISYETMRMESIFTDKFTDYPYMIETGYKKNTVMLLSDVYHLNPDYIGDKNISVSVENEKLAKPEYLYINGSNQWVIKMLGVGRTSLFITAPNGEKIVRKFRITPNTNQTDVSKNNNNKTVQNTEPKTQQNNTVKQNSNKINSSSGRRSSRGSGGGGSSSGGSFEGRVSNGQKSQKTQNKGSINGSWVFNGRWWYKNPDGTYPKNTWKQINNEWYYFDSVGYAVNNWLNDNGNWYYFNQDCKMVSGWVLDNGSWYYTNMNHDGTFGKIMAGWQFINGKYYYFNENHDGTYGKMFSNGKTPDNHIVNLNGEKIS